MAAGAEITQQYQFIPIPANKFRPQNNSESKRRPSERHYDGSFDREAIYEYFGNRVMKGHNTLDGHPVAIKFKTVGLFLAVKRRT
uniref:Uncharacterized protein n=1 Tax=Coccidioides posadasii RMSCC 3488 TaxID=454284 RepID=A0A0J6FJP4_COCPO|nr:hypothetical protein CPAG_05915 [Coccidioides posadasii RMSCC 3488]